MKIMKILREKERCRPTSPSEGRVVELRTPYGWRRKMPTLTVYVKANVKINSDLPIRNPDAPPRGIGVYVSPITGKSYPCRWKT